jgi:transcription elongation GreA/GreB family factor
MCAVIRLSKTENRPREGIVHIGQPLGSAVLGATVDDEIEVLVGGQRKTGVVERIDKVSN